MPHAAVPLEEYVDRLLKEARAGSSDALGELFECHRPYLLLIANEELGQAARARMRPSDVVQDVYLKVHDGFAQFRGESPDAWKAWLREVLHNTLHNCERDARAAKCDPEREKPLNGKAGGDSGKALPDPGSSPSSIFRRGERDQQLHDAIERLPAHYRAVVRLHSLEGVPFEEIAQRQGKSESAVRKLWGRAVEMLADLLEEPHESPP